MIFIGNEELGTKFALNRWCAAQADSVSLSRSLTRRAFGDRSKNSMGDYEKLLSLFLELRALSPRAARLQNQKKHSGNKATNIALSWW